MEATRIDWTRLTRLATWFYLEPEDVMPEEIQALAVAELKRRIAAGEKPEVDC